MKVSATHPDDGGNIEIVQVIPNGSDVYVVYIDSSNNLKTYKKTAYSLGITTSAVVLASNAAETGT